MATVNLFYDPVFRDGAFTANDARVRAYARAEDACARWISARSSARRSSCCGADAKAPKPTRAAGPTKPSSACARRSTISASTRSTASYGFRFALEAKPNEPRGDIYMATTGAYLGFIPTLDHPEMVGVNPEVAHEQMAGLNFMHAVAQAWEAGKLFHIDLNDQVPGRYDQDFRFGSANLKAAFWLVKFLEDVGYDGPRHFDAHAYRTEDYDGVQDFARGCMRTYLILARAREAMERRPRRFRRCVAELGHDRGGARYRKYSPAHRDSLLATTLRSRVARQEGAWLRAPRSADDGTAARGAGRAAL